MACDLFVNLLQTQDSQEDRDHLQPEEPRRDQRRQELAAAPHRGGPRRSGVTSFRRRLSPDELESTLKRIGPGTSLSECRLSGPGRSAACDEAGMRVLGDSRTTIRNGDWQGNDTCWRMALDLNRALLYGNPDGTWRDASAESLSDNSRWDRRRAGQRAALSRSHRVRRHARRNESSDRGRGSLQADGLRASEPAARGPGVRASSLAHRGGRSSTR